MSRGRSAKEQTRFNTERNRIYRAANREKLRAKDKIRREGNPYRYRDSYLRRKFKISEKFFETMLAAQDGRCAICKRTWVEDIRQFAVDHDHETGKIRGVLCSSCNRALGLMGDNVAALRAAVAYLERGTP